MKLAVFLLLQTCTCISTTYASIEGFLWGIMLLRVCFLVQFVSIRTFYNNKNNNNRLVQLPRCVGERLFRQDNQKSFA